MLDALSIIRHGTDVVFMAREGNTLSISSAGREFGTQISSRSVAINLLDVADKQRASILVQDSDGRKIVSIPAFAFNSPAGSTPDDVLVFSFSYSSTLYCYKLVSALEPKTTLLWEISFDNFVRIDTRALQPHTPYRLYIRTYDGLNPGRAIATREFSITRRGSRLKVPSRLLGRRHGLGTVVIRNTTPQIPVTAVVRDVVANVFHTAHFDNQVSEIALSATAESLFEVSLTGLSGFDARHNWELLEYEQAAGSDFPMISIASRTDPEKAETMIEIDGIAHQLFSYPVRCLNLPRTTAFREPPIMIDVPSGSDSRKHPLSLLDARPLDTARSFAEVSLEIATCILPTPGLDPSLQEELQSFAYAQAIQFSRRGVRFYDSLDDIIAEPNGDIVLIVSAGHFFTRWSVLPSLVDELQNLRVPLYGHLLSTSSGLYLDPQCILATSEVLHWARDLAAATSYKRNYMRSSVNVHDDYTPAFVTPAALSTNRTPISGFGARLIAAVLDAGQPIGNFPHWFREIKTHTYPHIDQDKFLALIKLAREYEQASDGILERQAKLQSINDQQSFHARMTMMGERRKRLRELREFVYLQNTESMTLAETSGGSLECYVGVAAGLKLEWIVVQRGMLPETRIVYIDISANGLKFKKLLREQWDGHSWDDAIELGVATGLFSLPSAAYREQVCTWFKNEVLPAFGGYDDWLTAWQNIRRLEADFVEMDITTQVDRLVPYVSGRKALLWWSNCFDYGFMYFQRGARDASAWECACAEKLAAATNYLEVHAGHGRLVR